MSEGQSKACCTIPPVLIENYEPKGTYVQLNDMKTYVTGPSDAKTAIFVVPDIFGYSPQQVEGADILSSIGKDGRYLVFIPDFFDGEPADVTNYPPKTDEGKAWMGKFFERIAPPKQLPRVPKVIEAAEKEYPSIKKWGLIGYCWGGKMASLAAGSFDTFSVAIQTSPAFLDPEDAKKIKIPFLSMPSSGEDIETIKKCHANISGVNKYTEDFLEQTHGYMSARCDWHDARAKAHYEKGYQTAGDWLNEHL